MDIANILDVDVAQLDGVGAATSRLLHLANMYKVSDVIFSIPYRYIERISLTSGTAICAGMVVTATVTILDHRASKKSFVAIAENQGKIIELTFFSNQQKLPYVLPIGSKRTISGTISNFAGNWQIAHPEIIRTTPPPYESVYHECAGVTSKLLGRLNKQILDKIPEISECNPLVEVRKWPGFKESLRIIHCPNSKTDMQLIDLAKTRLACDEALARHITMQKMRIIKRDTGGYVIAGNGSIANQVRSRLDFTLTDDQEKAISEIMQDQALPHRMSRILLGDVGSGKTLVALFAMLNAIECGKQAVLMVPTEILACQHYNKITKLLDGLGITSVLIAGKTRQRKKLEEDIKNGTTKIIIGAHALFQEKMEYHNLGLIVIDEQHRFGVEHRQFMSNKDEAADILFMSATPIPRSMLMLQYGYMDASVLTQAPSVRGKITTSVLPYEKLDTIISKISSSYTTSRPLKTYWICPLIEESEALDLVSVNNRFMQLTQIFGNKVGIVHSRISIEEKEEVIQKFLSGDIMILIATTVVEVGIDVPDANLIIIENAYRFGLSQLHQLRGRIARGVSEGFCILLHDDNADNNIIKRLHILRNNTDGFAIAEQDLKIRGGGNIVGHQQSGRFNYRFFNAEHHEWLLEEIKHAYRTSENKKDMTLLCDIFSHADGVM